MSATRHADVGVNLTPQTSSKNGSQVEPRPRSVSDESRSLTSADLIPFIKTLKYVVEEGRKHAAAGNDDHFVAVARVANAALRWYAQDRLGNFDEAQRYLDMIPKGSPHG